MSVVLSEKEFNTFEKNGATQESIQATVDYYRANGFDDNAIRQKIDKKLNDFSNDYDAQHLSPTLKGQVNYNDILLDKNLTSNEKGDLIKQRGEDERKELDKEFLGNTVPMAVGAGVKVLSPLAATISLPASGAIYGLGDGIENKDSLPKTLGKMGLYSGANMMGGAVGSKATQVLPAFKNKFADLLLKSGIKGGSFGGFDGLAYGINENIDTNKFNPNQILQSGLWGTLFGSALGVGGTVSSNFLPKINKIPFASIEKFRQFLLKGNMRHRGLMDSNILNSSNEINAFINETKGLSKSFGINDKTLREIMPFIRENTGLPTKNFNRNDLIEAYNSLSPEQILELRSVANKASSVQEKYWNEYLKLKPNAGKSNSDTYISHIWDLDKKQESLLSNYFNNHSKYSNRRAIPSYKRGIEGIRLAKNNTYVSLKPKTLDYAEILKEHSHNVIKTASTKRYTNVLKDIKTPDGKPLFIKSRHSGYVEMRHPALDDNIYVDKRYRDVLSSVFETPVEKTKFGDIFDKVNNFTKTCKFILNGMHAVALTETSAAHESIIPLKTFKTLVNLPKIIDGIKNNNYELFKQSKLAQFAIKDGVQFGAISDINISEFTTGLDDVIKFLDKSTLGLSKPLTKSIRTFVDINNKYLWNYLHNTYKLDTYRLLIQRYQAKSSVLLSKEVRQEIGQVVNDTFGGQNWDTLGIKPSSIQNARRVLLSPDWNMSTLVRHSLAVFSSEGGQKLLNKAALQSESGAAIREFSRKVGLSSFTNDIKGAGVRGQIARQFFIRFVIQSAIYSNIVNVACRLYDKKNNPELYKDDENLSVYNTNKFNEDDTFLKKATDTIYPRAFVGRSNNGREMYARMGKQAREMPELLEDGLKGSIKKIASKTSPLINPIATYSADKFLDGWNKEDIAKRYSKTFTPFSLSSSEYHPINSFYSTTKGTNFYQSKDYIKKSLKNSDLKAIESISKKLEKNKIDPIGVIKTSAREIMLEAMLNDDKETVEKTWNDLEKLGVNPDKVFYSAAYKYIESKGENGQH